MYGCLPTRVIHTQLFTEMCKVKSDREINLEVQQLEHDIVKAAGTPHSFHIHSEELKRGKGLIQLNLWKFNKSYPCCKSVTSCLCCKTHSVSLQ